MAGRFVELVLLVSTVLFDQFNAPLMLDREGIDTLKEMVAFSKPIEQATRDLPLLMQCHMQCYNTHYLKKALYLFDEFTI